MKTIITGEKQTIYDIAAQYYGTAEAVAELLKLNADIENETPGDNLEFYFHLPIKPGSRLTMDENSPLINKNLLKEITETVTTFEAWQEL